MTECPCEIDDSRVTETRTQGDRKTKIRRHKCKTCGKTYKTYQVPEAFLQEMYAAIRGRGL